VKKGDEDFFGLGAQGDSRYAGRLGPARALTIAYAAEIGDKVLLRTLSIPQTRSCSRSHARVSLVQSLNDEDRNDLPGVAPGPGGSLFSES
jgi:hypothetical protein